MKEMDVQIIDDTSKEVVRRRVANCIKNGWKKKGEIKKYISFIPYTVVKIEKHPVEIYYQELSREDKLC